MDEERLSQLYNLIINPGTRDWERSQLLAARDRLESGQEQKCPIRVGSCFATIGTSRQLDTGFSGFL